MNKTGPIPQSLGNQDHPAHLGPVLPRFGTPPDPDSRKVVWTMDRFWKKVDKDGPNGCWLWTAGKLHDGYGRFWLDGEVRAHRVSYELLVGPIPEGLVLDHLCRVRHCVNPEHLEPVTSGENSRRGDTGKHNSRKTHCPKGHPYSGDNLMIYDHRMCRTCNRDAAREWWRRNRAKAHYVPRVG